MKDATYYKGKLFRVKEAIQQGNALPHVEALVDDALTPEGPAPVTTADFLNAAYRLSKALEKHGYKAAAALLWSGSAHNLPAVCGIVWDELTHRVEMSETDSHLINASYALGHGELEDCCKALANLAF